MSETDRLAQELAGARELLAACDELVDDLRFQCAALRELAEERLTEIENLRAELAECAL